MKDSLKAMIQLLMSLKYNLDGKISDEVTHYIAYFQTTNGFEKYNVMSKEEVREHAKKFSKNIS